jgi:hypothetical protein
MNADAKEPGQRIVKLVDGVCLADLHSTLQNIVSSLFSGDVLELTLASVLNSARVNDILVWMVIVGVPSCGKTETVLGVRHEPTVYYLDKLTDHAFVSGYVRKDGTSPTDLLAELNGKCLVVKDLSPLFSARPEITKGVIGDMVSIYDGSFSAKFGTKEKVTYETRFSFVACVTPKAIQGHQTYMSELGSRPLMYRVPALSDDEKETGKDMILKDGKRKERIELYGQICSSYAHSLLKAALAKISLPEEHGKTLSRMADLLASGRAVGLASEHDGNASKDFQVEEPFRILLQLRSLVCALAVVHGRREVTDHEMELARRVVLSTVQPNRGSVLALFQNAAALTPEGGITVKVCSEHLALGTSGADRLLNELVGLGILEADTSRREHQYKPRPVYADLVTKPIEPINHVADLATVDVKQEAQTKVIPSPT